MKHDALILELRERIDSANVDIEEDQRRIADLLILVDSARKRQDEAAILIASATIAIKALES